MPLVSPEVIAQWPKPNYDNPVSRGPDLYVINSVFIVVAGTLVVLRIYTRVFVTHFFGWDDGFIIAGLIFAIILTIGVDLGFSRYGWDRHIWDIPLSKTTSSLILTLGMQLDFILAQLAINISFLCFYFRLTSETNLRWFRSLLYFCMSFITVASVLYIFLLIFQCQPVQAQWTPVEGARCLDYTKIVLSANIIKVLFDVLITTVPIPLIVRMKISRHQKLGVVILLSLGYVVTAAGALRTYYTWLLSVAPLGDETWDLYPAFITTNVETDLSIICACVPTMRPLIRRILNLKTAVGTSNMLTYGSRTFASNYRKRTDTQLYAGDRPSEAHWPLRTRSATSGRSTTSNEKEMELPIMGPDSVGEMRDLDSRNASAMSTYERREIERDETPKEVPRVRTSKEFFRVRTSKELPRDRASKEVSRGRTSKELSRDRASKEVSRGRTSKELSRDGEAQTWVIRIHDEFTVRSEENLENRGEFKGLNGENNC